MTVDQLGIILANVDRIRNLARKLADEADSIEATVLAAAGIREHPREPGFACWSYDGGAYYNTPMEAMRAKASEYLGERRSHDHRRDC